MNKMFCILVVLLAMILVVPTTFAITVDNTGLLAYYKMDDLAGNAVDSFGGYNGYNTGVSYGVAGVLGTAYYYDPASSANTVINTPLILTNMTIAAWYKGTEATNYIVLKRIGVGADPAYSYRLGVYGGDPIFSRGYTTGMVNVIGPAAVNDGAWHFIVGDQNATGLYIYVDGVLAAFQAKTGTLGNNFWNTAAQISSDNYNFGFISHSKQSIDEVGIWTRDLNQAEISSLYNAGVGQTYCPSSGTFSDVCDIAVKNIRVKVADEVTWADLNNVSIVVDSVLYNTNANGYVDINFVGKAAGYHEFTFVKDDYVSEIFHYYYYDTSAVFRFALIKEDNSITVPFKFTNPYSNAILANGYQTLYKRNPSTYDIWYTSNGLTNSIGEVTFSIDANYQKYYTVLSTGYTLTPMLLTISRPRAELTDTNIDLNWNISTTNTHNAYYNDQNDATSLYVVPNTKDYMFIEISVDTNNYDSRTYFLKYDSNDTINPAAHDYLTPYLAVSKDIGTWIQFITQTKTRITIPYVDFIVSKLISGADVQVMAGRTDITGSRLLPFVVGQNYSIRVEKDGIEYADAHLYTATATPVYWYIDLGTTDIDIREYFIATNISWSPNGPVLIGTDTSIDITMAGDDLNKMTYTIYQYHDINHLTGIKVQQSGGKNCSGISCTINVVLPLMDTNKSFYFDVNLVYNNGDSNVSITKVYTKTSGTSLNPFTFALNVRKDFGCTTDINNPCALGMIISVLLTIFGLYGIMKVAGITFGTGIVVISVLLLGVFTFIGWFYWPLYLFIIAAGILASAAGFAKGGN